MLRHTEEDVKEHDSEKTGRTLQGLLNREDLGVSSLFKWRQGFESREKEQDLQFLGVHRKGGKLRC